MTIAATAVRPAGAFAPAGRVVLGVSACHAKRADSEHLLADVLAVLRRNIGDDEIVACTHLVNSPWRHEALSIEGPADLDLVEVAHALDEDAALVCITADQVLELGGPPAVLGGATEAALAHTTRAGGRAVVYPGQHLLVGDVPVTDVIALTAVDAVLSSHGAYAEDAVLVTGGYVRPVFQDGRLVVLAGHADPRRLMPWEVRNPIPCCGADH